jgi:hypothetical protein
MQRTSTLFFIGATDRPDWRDPSRRNRRATPNLR